MSMICNFRSIPRKTLNEIIKKPSLLEALFSLDHEIEEIILDGGVKVLLPVSMIKVLETAEPVNKKRMTDMYRKNVKMYNRMFGEMLKKREEMGDIDPGEGMDIDKAWHGIHYLLTGEAWGGKPPLFNAIMGGKEIGGDTGYGPARFLTPEQVKETAEALEKISSDELRNRFDLEKFLELEIYAITSEDDHEYLLEYFARLVDFYRDAAGKGYGLIIYMT